MKTLRSIFTFYKSFALVSFMLTLICLNIIYINGIKTFTLLFWFKILTMVLIFNYVNSYKKKEFYYYKNLGISKLQLWLPILIFDLFVFLVLMITLMVKINDTHA